MISDATRHPTIEATLVNVRMDAAYGLLSPYVKADDHEDSKHA